MYLYHLYHQNMLCYGPNSNNRTQAFCERLAQIKHQISPVAVAGFTEITTGTQSMFDNLKLLASSLDPDLKHVLLCWIGTTLGNSDRPEYIGIAWNGNEYPVEFAGQVVYDSMNQRWTALVGEYKPNIVAMGAPDNPNIGTDSRGLAFVAGVVAGRKMLCGFMHNMYGVGNRTGGFENIGNIASKALEAVVAKDNKFSESYVYIGGDFNVGPREISDRVPVQLRCVAEKIEHEDYDELVKTTIHHTYDFWLTNDHAVDDDAASVHPETRWSPPCSDHAGISLGIDA